MAVTRIKNNQITDSTITYQKIASGTLVGSLFNPNLTFNSNISIVGNLQVNGNTTTVNSIDTLISDPLVTLNNGYVGLPSYDVGLLFNRALGSLENYGGVNAALVWSESDGAFITVLTTDTGTTTGTINRAFKANLIAGNITAANAINAERATVTTLNVTNLYPTNLVASGNIVAASGVNATNYTTGALVVPNGGGVGITGDLWVQGPSTFQGNINAGNIQLSGNINVPVGGTLSSFGVFYGNAGGIGALYAGTSTYTSLPTTVFQMTGNVNSYAQTNFQNLNNGASATTDYILTADNGTDDSYYGDFGILSSAYDGTVYESLVNGLGTVGYPNDTYLYAHGSHSNPGVGGNLLLGTSVPNTLIRTFVGGSNVVNIVTTITTSGLVVNATTNSSSINTGALIVNGGVGINGNIHAAAINNTPIGNAIPNTGAFTTVTADNFSSTTLNVTNFSTGNAVITGGYITGLANANAIVGTFATLNSSAANVTGPLFASSLNTANAVITGGYAQGLANIDAIIGSFGTSYSAILNATDGNITGSLYAGSINTANAVISGGYISALTNATITTASIGSLTAATLNSSAANVTGPLFASSLNTANAVITGGYIQGLSNIYATTGEIDNFSSSNVLIAGGYIDGTVIGANAAAAATFTNVTGTGQAIFNSGTPSDNTSTGAIVVTGGVGVSGNVNVGANLTVFGNLDVKGTITTVESTTVTIADKNIEIASTAASAAQADGAGITVNGANATITYAVADDSWNLNKQLFAPTVTTPNLNTTNGNATTLVATNFSTGNAVISGGYISALANATITTGNAGIWYAATLNSTTANITNESVTTGVTTNFSTANAVITGGYINDIANLTATTAQTTNFSTGNAVISGGYISALSNAYITTSQITNFSTANAVISGGSLNDVIIGNATPASGNFTILNVTANVHLAPKDTPGTVTIKPLNLGSMDNMDIGATTQANAYVTNLRSADSVWASTSGTIFLRAGTSSGSSINNIVIGSTDPAAGTFTTLNSQTLTAPTINGGDANITGAVYAGSINTANAVISGGYISALSNATITTGNSVSWTTAVLNTSAANVTGPLFASSLNTANAVITGGYITDLANANASVGTFTTLNTSFANISGNVISTGNIVITNGDPVNYTQQNAVALNTGALIIKSAGGIAVGGNAYIGGGAVINGTKSANNEFYARGVNESSLLFVSPTGLYDAVSIGGNITNANLVLGAKLSINSTDSLLLPVGTNAQRPSSQGFTDVQGMIRFNTTSNQIEYYNGSAWQGTSTTFTVITDTQFASLTGDVRGNVDGVNTTFVLPSATTTNSTIVSINGVLQLPGVAYSVFSGNTSLVFTEAPAIGDNIDVRILTTTATVDTLSSGTGFNYIQAIDEAIKFYSGNVLVGSNERWRIDTAGTLYSASSSNIGASTNRVSNLYAGNLDITGSIQANSASGQYIAPSNSGSVAGFDKTINRGGEFLVTLDSGTEYQISKVLVIHDGTNANTQTFATTYTGASSLGTFSANVLGNTIWLNATSSGSNLQVKVTSTLLKV